MSLLQTGLLAAVIIPIIILLARMCDHLEHADGVTEGKSDNI